MAKIHRRDCPRCGTKSVELREEDRDSACVITHFKDRGYARVDVFAVCGYCRRGVVLTFERDSTTNARGSFLELAPSPLSFDAPKYTPENAARYYAQALKNLSGNWDAAGAMFRKTLDTALKHKFSDLSGTLQERIQKAADNHQLTPDMAAWAHHVRLGGNEAVHDDEPFSEDAAVELAAFTKLVLIYLFRLPGMIEKSRRSATNEENQT